MAKKEGQGCFLLKSGISKTRDGKSQPKHFDLPSATCVWDGKSQSTNLLTCSDKLLLWQHLGKENKWEGQCAHSKGRLVQLQIQPIQVMKCGYKNNCSKFIMAKPLKWPSLYFNFQKCFKNEHNIGLLTWLLCFCHLCLYLEFFTKFLFHIANLSGQKL